MGAAGALPSRVLTLGGTASIFKGVFDHPVFAPYSETPSSAVLWDNGQFPWHFGRPFTGTIVGIFVFLAFRAVYPSGNPSGITLAVASFVLGTQDRAFFNYVKQIGAVIVSVPNKTNDSGKPGTQKASGVGE